MVGHLLTFIGPGAMNAPTYGGFNGELASTETAPGTALEQGNPGDALEQSQNGHVNGEAYDAVNGLANGHASGRPGLKRVSAADLIRASEGTKSRKRRYARAVRSRLLPPMYQCRLESVELCVPRPEAAWAALLWLCTTLRT